MKDKCFTLLSEYRKRRCRCHEWWETILEVGARNPFADGNDRANNKLCYTIPS